MLINTKPIFYGRFINYLGIKDSLLKDFCKKIKSNKCKSICFAKYNLEEQNIVLNNIICRNLKFVDIQTGKMEIKNLKDNVFFFDFLTDIKNKDQTNIISYNNDK